MANTLTPPVFPFDPQGTMASNKITGERQVIEPPDWSDFYFIVPKATPYFAESLVMVLQPSGKELVEGVDYNPTHRFYDASLQCASPVYGSITFLDRTLAGVIDMTYQTLGGDWTVDSTTIAQVLANVLDNPRTTTWEEVVDVPYQFPPIDHEWDIVDMIGASKVVDALDRMTVALQQSGDQGLANHLADFGNPHRTNATQVGLGNVPNLPLALQAEAIAGVSSGGLMTPALTAAAINAQAVTPLNDHIGNTGNPHGVNKTQVGLGLVNNFGFSTTLEATTGVSTTGYMNPALTKAAVQSMAVAPLNAHLADLGNPHQTSAAQVGLGNVPNFPMATLTEALAGNATDRMMSPSLVRQVMQGNLGGSLTAHIADHNNPHQVVASQVGLGLVNNFPMATDAQAQAGVDTSTYMSPALTASYVGQALVPFASHLNDHGNPHQTSKDQVGLPLVNNFDWASTTDAIAGSDIGGYMNAVLTKAAITAQVGNDFAIHKGDLDNPHQTTADQVGAYTTAEVDTAIQTVSDAKLDKTGVAADSDKLGGKTLAEVVASVPIPPASLVARQQLPGVTDPGASWTELAHYDTGLNLGTVSLPPVTFYVVGGEPSTEYYNKPIYRINLNPNDVGVAEVEQLAGYRGQLAFGYVLDSETLAVSIYAQAGELRGPIALLIESDPVEAFSLNGSVVFDAPEGIQLFQINETSVRSRSANIVPGQLAFGAPNAFDSSHSGVQYDTLVQNVTVLESGESTTAAQAALVDWSMAIPHFQRLAGLGPNSVNAGSRLGWRWDPVQSKVVRAGVASFDQLVSNQLTGTNGHTLEALLSSDDSGDMAIGLVAAYTDRNGQPQAFHVMRDLGGLSAQSSAAHRGKLTYKLFSIGYNLFADDAVDLGSTDVGLLWGDGVSSADRTDPTTYQTVANGGSGSGWSDRGAIAIRVTVTLDGQGFPVFVFETSNYGAVEGSITYVDSAKVTFSTAGSTHQGVLDLVQAFRNEGVRWGFCAYRQVDPTYQMLISPDKFVRYVTLSQDADGTNTSLINSYNGSAWVQTSLIGTSAKAGRLFVSDLNQRVYQSCQDGSLQPVNILGYNGTGRAILTT